MTFWEYLDRAAERRAVRRRVDARLFANVVGAALVAGFLGALITLFFVPIPERNEQLITYMIGQLSGFAGGIIAYHYTLTAGAKELDAKRAETTGKLVDLATAAAAPGGGAGRAADEVVDAAADKAAEIKEADPSIT
jgi:cytochrome c biogenesis protein CcdA